MPPPSSFLSSSGGSIAGVLGGSTSNKDKISINFDHDYAAKVYTSNSTVAGHVSINPGPKDLRFDHLQITLHGCTKTRLNGIRGQQVKVHKFLELHMPIAEESYPVPRVYEADRTYNIPFSFVIPKKLVLGQCGHACQNANVQEHHRALPPSMGNWLKNDMAPDMARVKYKVKALLYRELDESEMDQELGVEKKKTITLLQQKQQINVLPAFSEQPPLGITKNDIKYVMTESRSIKRTMISPKSGELTVTAAQPAAVMLSADGHTARTTRVALDFRFDPSTTESPTPNILHVRGKVNALTFASVAAMGDTPNLGNWVATYGPLSRFSYDFAVRLPDFPVTEMKWKQDPNRRSRRDSGYGSEEHATSGSETAAASRRRRSTAPTSPFSYSATLQVPIDLPMQAKTFLPTFQTCFASRAYILELRVVVSSGAPSTKTLTVKVPLQIGVDSASQLTLRGPEPPSFQAAVEESASEESPVQHRGELPGYSESR